VPQLTLLVAGVRSCTGQSSTGVGFLRVLRFPLPSIPLTASHSWSSIIIIWGWYNGLSNSGLGSISPQRKKISLHECSLSYMSPLLYFMWQCEPGTSYQVPINPVPHSEFRALLFHFFRFTWCWELFKRKVRWLQGISSLCRKYCLTLNQM
jgi:hypothetical protein